MKRRAFISLLGVTAAAWPLVTRAEQAGKIPRVGYLRAGTPNNDQVREEFVRGMRDLGYVEGRNITYEFRHSTLPTSFATMVMMSNRYLR